MNEQDFQELSALYQWNPYAFSSDTVDELQLAARTMGVRFQRQEEADAFDLVDTVKQLGQGFLQGFTTLSVGEEPSNEIESIARSIGHLAGFVGFIPGEGLLGRFAATGVARAFGVAGLARDASLAIKGIRGISVPMAAADAVVGKLTALSSVRTFLQRGRIGSVAEEALKLGVASGVSEWQHGIDAMVAAAGYGAFQGAGFRAIGNFADVGKLLTSEDPAFRAGANRAVRGIASALFSGLPATLQGQPLPSQVYAYLLGAYFGGAEPDYAVRRAGQFIQDAVIKPSRSADLTPEERAMDFRERALGIQKLESFGKLEPEVQAEALTQAHELFGRTILVQGEQFGSAEAVQLLALREALRSRGITDEQAWNQMHDALLENRAKAQAAQKSAERAQETLTGQPAPTVPAAADLAGQRPPGGTARTSIETPVQTEVQQSFEDHEIPNYLRDPLKRFTQMVVDANGEVVSEGRVVRSVLDRFSSMPDHSEASWQSALDGIRLDLGDEVLLRAQNPDGSRIFVKVKDRIEMDRAGEGYRTLRQAWKRMEQDYVKPQDQVLVSLDGRMEVAPLGTRDEKGNPVVETVAPSLLDRMGLRLGNAVHSITRAVRGRLDERGRLVTEQQNVHDDTELTGPQLLEALYRKGTPYAGSVKDKGEIKTTQGFVFETAGVNLPGPDGALAPTPVRRDEAASAARAKMESLDAAVARANERLSERGRAPIAPVGEAYGKLLERFRQDYPHLTEAQAEEMYLQSWLNQVAIIEDLNQLPMERMIEANASGEGSFVLGVSGWNKRMQLLSDGSPTVTSDVMRQVEGAEDGLRFAIVNGVRSGGKPIASGIEPMLLERIGRDGEVEQYAGEHHLDGVFFLRSDAYDKMAEDMGLDPSSGTAKGVVAYNGETGRSGEQLGMMLGKFAYFRADEALDKALREAPEPLHAVMYDTAAKQHGLRKKYDIEVQQDGSINFYSEGSKNPNPFKKAGGGFEAYTIPFEGMRVNISVSEDTRHAVEDQHVPRQLPANMTDPAAIDRYMERYVKPSFEGDEATNLKAQLYLETRDEKLLEEIDPDRLGVDMVMNILTRPGHALDDNALWQKVWRRVLRVSRERVGSEDNVDFGAGTVESAFADSRMSGASNRILDVAVERGLLSPALLHNPKLMEPYALSALRNYVVDRVLRPVAPGSGVAILQPQDPHFQLSLKARQKAGELPVGVKGGHLESGFFMLGESWKSKKIEWVDGEKVTLEEAWNQYRQALESGEKALAAQMKEQLSFAVIRVPADSVSGTRMLQFAGFSGRRGAGMTLHNEDMISIGGADLDIDKAFLFQNMDGRGAQALKSTTQRPEPASAVRTVEGDLFQQPGRIVVPTNMGGVHGAGVAHAARAQGLIRQGEGRFGVGPRAISFPVKHKWNEKADVSLIRDSISRLDEYLSAHPDEHVSMPLVGMGHGELDPAVVIPMLRELASRHSNLTIVLPTEKVLAGVKKGTARHDSSLSRMDEIRSLLGGSHPSARPRLSLEGSAKKSPFFAKDQKKASEANKFIGRGGPTSSTEAYRKATGASANTGRYDSSDVVFVSAEGNRPGRVPPNLAEIGRAVDARAVIITDTAADRSRPYNVGEREVASYLKSRGYREIGPGRWAASQKQSNRPIYDHMIANRDQWYDRRFFNEETGEWEHRVIIDAKEQEDLFVRRLEDFEKHPVAVADPRLLYQAGEGARRGNRTLGVFAVSGRRGNVIHQLYGGREVPLRVGKSEAAALAEALKLKPTEQVVAVMGTVADDRSTFDKIRRAGMNFAADAGNYAGLSMDAQGALDVMGRALIPRVRAVIQTGVREVVNKRTGEAEKVFDTREVELTADLFSPRLSQVDVGRMMSRADSFANGRRFGSDERFTLWQSLDGFRNFSFDTGGSRDVPVELPNSWYRSLSMLGRLAYRPVGADGQVRSDMAPWLGPQWETTYMKAINEIGSRANAGDALARHVMNVTARRAIQMRENNEASAWQLTQDLSDAASILNLYDAGRYALGNKVELRELEGIARTVDDLKAQAGAARKGSHSRGLSLEEVHQNISAYRESLPSPERQAYFDAYMLGTFSPQEVTLNAFMKESRGRFIQDAMRGSADRPALAQDRAELLWDSFGEAQAKRFWWRTNQQLLGFQLDAVPDASVESYLRRFNDIAQASWKEELTPEEQARVAAISNPRKDPVIAAVTGDEANGEVRTIEAEEYGRSLVKKVFGLKGEFEDVVRGLPEAERAQMRVLYDDLQALFKAHPQLIDHYASSFEFVTSQGALYGVTPERAVFSDVRRFVDEFQDVRRGVLLREVYDDVRNKKGIPFKKLYHMFFPDTISRLHAPFDVNVGRTVARPVLTTRGIVVKEVRDVFSHFGKQHQFISGMQTQGDIEIKRLAVERSEETKELRSATGSDWNDLYEISVAIREYRGASAPGVDNPYAHELNRRAARRKELEGKEYYIPTGGQPRRITGRELMGSTEEPGLINQMITRRMERMRFTIISNGQAEQKWFVLDEDGGLDPYRTMDRLVEELNRTDKLPWIGIEGHHKIEHEHFLRERVTASLTEVKNQVDALRRTDQIGDAEYASVMARLNALIEQGSGPMTLEELTRAKAISKSVYRARLRLLRERYPFKGTGVQDPGGYFPHNGHAEKDLQEFYQRMVTRLTQEGMESVNVDLYVSRIKHGVAEGHLSDLGMSDWLRDQVLSPRSVREDQNAVFTTPSMMPRTNIPVPGWDHSPRAVERYESQLLRAYYNGFSATVGQRLMKSFREQQVMGEHTEAWARFGDLYTRSVLGGPSIFPKSWVDPKHPDYNREFDFRSSPTWYTSDHAALEKLIQADQKITGGSYTRGATVDNAKGQRLARVISHWTQMEGKWEMMSLLASTKGMTNNYVGGTLQTAVSAGWGPWMRAGSLNELQRINPKWKGWDDVERFVERGGGIESWIAEEVGIPIPFRGGRGAMFWDEALQALRKDPNVPDAKLLEIARRHGVSETMFRSAAWFMQSVERKLRRRAFLAHYLKAHEAFEASGVVFEPDHPWLMAQARKGVQATQFLYDNANRPAFSRTNLGRMLTRFQLWSWNSIRFQRDVLRGAAANGFRPGTESFDRFKRMAQINLFMFALASVFPSSLFDNILPAPWNYVQESADLLLGNEEERKRAFFGTLPGPLAPLQAVSPPVARMPMSIFGATLSGDWDRLTAYHMWSWFPFGLAARNVYKTYQNPAMVAEQMTGFPLHRLHRELRKAREADEPTGEEE